MDEVLFSGDTVKKGDTLYFTCTVKYPSELDPFLPSQLTMRTDGPGASIAPFSNGKGQFDADSLEHAEETEAEIKALLETAYGDMFDMQNRIQKWSGSRKFSLSHEEEAVEILPAL